MHIAFIGLGRMGSRICRNFVAAGHPVRAFDTQPDALAAAVAAGAEGARDIASAVQGAQLIVTSLPGPDEVQAVVSGPQGFLEHAAAGAVYADLSTNSPTLVRELGRQLDARGVTMLDAPVSGGTRGAEQQSLALMVGGDPAALARCHSIFTATAATITHVGPLGCGSIAKLVNNMLVFNSVTAAAEALTLGTAAGIAPDVLNDVIRNSSGDSVIFRAVARKVLRDDWSPNFSLDLAAKDLRLALSLADELDVPLLLGPQSHNLMRMARGMGLGDQDMAAVTRVFEQTLGIAARSDKGKT